MIFLADAHLQRGAWTHRSIRGDALFAFEQAISLAVTKGMSVVSAGDLFDVARPTSDIVCFYQEQVRRLSERGLAFLTIQGNHEFCDTPWSQVAGGAVWLDRRTRTIGSDVLYGLDWRPADKLAAALAEIPKEATLLLCHQVWEELTAFSPEGSLSDVPHHIHTVITGDCHRSKKFTVSRPGGPDLTVISPGALAPQNVTEPATPFVWLWRKGKWLQVPLDHRLVIDIDPALSVDAVALACIDMLPELLEKARKDSAHLPTHLQEPLVVVKYSGQGVSPVYRKRIEDLIRDGGGHPFALMLGGEGQESEELPVMSDRVAVGEGKRFLTEVLHSYFVQQGHPEEWSAGLQQLLSSPDRKEALRRMRKEAGVEGGGV